ncbi:TonB-dependent receptor [Lichenicola sp.]|uniref:TonB-dependent receptor n=1 Tax=Lichenicola sp. TaxID=2804529 RepID=UPI003B00745F
MDTANGPVGGQAGGGLIRPETAAKSTSTASSDFIRRQAPTENAFQLVSLLPGANVATSDPLGISAEDDLSLRGLDGDEIGYTLEGMPLNDIAYYTGYPGQFADTENIDHVSLSQGTGDLATPVINAAGGLLSVTLRDPTKQAGGLLEGAYGSYHTNREFIRLDTGDLGTSGIRGFVSYSNTSADNWRGPGRDKRQHIDFKFVRDWSNGDRVALIGTWNDAVTSAYPQPTQADWKQYGRSGPDNYDGTYTPGDTNYWRLYQQPYRLFYLLAPTHIRVSQSLSFDATPYAQYGYGNTPGGATLPTSGLFEGTQPVPGMLSLPGVQNGQVTVASDYQQASYRAGVVPKLTWTLGNNTIVAGVWYDYSDDREPAPFNPVSADGTPADIWVNSSRGTIVLADGRQLLAQNEHTITQVNALFLGDTISLLDHRLSVDLGFKEVMVTRQGWNDIPGATYRTGANGAEPLPRIGMRYQIDHRNQVFASVSTNFRTPSAPTLFDSFDPTSGTLESRASTNLRDEYSISEEVGYRRDGDWLIGSVTAFNYNFTNRQIATVIDLNGVLTGSTINAGGQTSRGVDAEVGLRPWHHLSPYMSGEYLHATIDNDLAVDGDLLPTAGHVAVRSPAWQGAVGLTYDDGMLFGTASVKYVGPEYASFMDDEKIADHAQGDITLGVRLPTLGPAKHPEFRLNLVNVTDTNVLSGIAAPTTNARTVIGRYGTVIPGSPATYYVGPGFAALLTVSSAF